MSECRCMTPRPTRIHEERIAMLGQQVEALERQVAMDTQRFKEIEQSGLELEQQVEALSERVADLLVENAHLKANQKEPTPITAQQEGE